MSILTTSTGHLRFDHKFPEEVSIIKLLVHSQLAKSIFFALFEECIDHLANEFKRLFLLFLISGDQAVGADVLQASKAFKNEAIVDELLLIVESNRQI